MRKRHARACVASGGSFTLVSAAVATGHGVFVTFREKAVEPVRPALLTDAASH